MYGMNDMDWLDIICMIIGYLFLLYICFKTGYLVTNGFMWAAIDAVKLFSQGELKQGYGWWHWLHILPSRFFTSWWKTMVDRLSGIERIS